MSNAIDEKITGNLSLMRNYLVLSTAIILIDVLFAAWAAFGVYQSNKQIESPNSPFSLADYLSDFGPSLHRFALYEIAILLMIGAVYLLPTFLASYQRHHDTMGVAVLNIFVGWTIVGWIASLLWAFSPPHGLAVSMSNLRQRASPTIERLRQGTEDFGAVMQKHPMLREATQSVDRALGGRLRSYAVPPEGIDSLISDISISRSIEGSLQVFTRFALPAKTQLKFSICTLNSADALYSATCILESEGWLRLRGIMNAGRPFPKGDYNLRFETLPFEFGVQLDWLIDAVGEHGKNLPHSATVPVDQEFPHYGRKLDETRLFPLTELSVETLQIEAVKTAVLNVAAFRPQTVESVLRDRLAARSDERLVDGQAWSVEQVAEDRWIVSLSFTRRDRPSVAQWEVRKYGNAIRYLDPDAKVLSGV